MQGAGSMRQLEFRLESSAAASVLHMPHEGIGPALEPGTPLALVIESTTAAIPNHLHPTSHTNSGHGAASVRHAPCTDESEACLCVSLGA